MFIHGKRIRPAYQDNAGEKQDINVQKEISKAIRRREKKYITQIEEAKELLETVDKIWD